MSCGCSECTMRESKELHAEIRKERAMEKDKVESRTFKFFTFSDEQKQQMRVAGLTENDIQNITQYRQGLLAQEARDKVMSDYMAELAARPSVPQQGQADGYSEGFDLDDIRQLVDANFDALKSNAFGLKVLRLASAYERLAASRSEEAPQDDWNEPCNQCDGFRGHAEGCTGHRAPAAGSTEWKQEEETVRQQQTKAGRCRVCKGFTTYARQNSKTGLCMGCETALTGTDTDVAKEK